MPPAFCLTVSGFFIIILIFRRKKEMKEISVIIKLVRRKHIASNLEWKSKHFG
jgi:hypothetical protein